MERTPASLLLGHQSGNGTELLLSLVQRSMSQSRTTDLPTHVHLGRSSLEIVDHGQRGIRLKCHWPKGPQ